MWKPGTDHGFRESAEITVTIQLTPISAEGLCFAKEEILERLVLFPAIGATVALVGGQYPTVRKVFGKYDQRCVGQIHRQVRVLVHQLQYLGSSSVPAAKI